VTYIKYTGRPYRQQTNNHTLFH